jgi:segregation and condensation protein B
MVENQASSDPDALLQRVEAILFLARKPLNSRKIAQLAQLEDGTQARTMIGHLNRRYDEVGRAFHVKKISGGFQMLTRPQFFDWINRLEHSPNRVRLSSPARETLTVVAYRQPIIKADIESIRGVGCGEMLRQLLEKGLVKISGRSEDLGRPFLYATTQNFLTEFGLNSLQELPKFDTLAGPGIPNWSAAEIEESDVEDEEEDDEDEDEDDEEEDDDE